MKKHSGNNIYVEGVEGVEGMALCSVLRIARTTGESKQKPNCKAAETADITLLISLNAQSSITCDRTFVD